MTRKVLCDNWDSGEPEKLRDAQTGNLIGVLLPRIDAATLEASPGIQPCSVPGGVPDVEMYDPGSIVKFAEHWERVYGKTYPLADVRKYAAIDWAADIKPETKLEADARKARNYNFSGD